jgi:hypothetical protein
MLRARRRATACGGRALALVTPAVQAPHRGILGNQLPPSRFGERAAT